MERDKLIDIAKYIQTARLDYECGIIWAVNDKNDELQHLADVRGWGHIQNMFKIEQEAMDFQDAIGQFITDAINEKIANMTALNGKDLTYKQIIMEAARRANSLKNTDAYQYGFIDGAVWVQNNRT